MSVYLDHAATTPLRPEAADAYVETARALGNPSSIHSAGREAARRLAEARETVAATLGCEPVEVVFTSGGTEAINLALKGLYWGRNGVGPRRPRPRILAAEGEHHATMDALEWLEHYEGARLEPLPLDDAGRLRDAEAVAAFAGEPERTALATSLWVNNEVGAIEPVERLAALAAGAEVPLHVDAVAAYGHLAIDFGALRRSGGSGASGIVALSVSAHKIGGPVGIGALVLSRDADVVPLVHGGGQQRGVRSGTQDVPAAAAFALAARAAETERDREGVRLAGLRDRLIRGVLAAVPEARLNGPDPDGGDRVPGNAHFSFPGCEGDSLLFLLDAAGVCVSTGSACQAGIPEPSHVLRAMGRDERAARGAVRVTLGATSTKDDVEAFLSALPDAHARARRAGLAADSPHRGR